MAEDKKLVGERYKFTDQREKAVLEDVLTKLEKAVEYSNTGKKDEAEAIRQGLINSLNAKLEQHEKNRGAIKNHADFDRSVLPKKGCNLGKNDKVVLRAASEQDYENYMAVSYECSAMRSAFKDDEFKNDLWESFITDDAANYSILDKISGKYIGYCGIKDLSRDRWEIAIELLEKFRGKNYGYNALVVMLDSLSNLTGEVIYRTRVDADNYASQGLMKKIGARPDGISEMFIHGAELERFQEENKNLIDDRIKEVAKEFCVDPIDLIGHVLEYRIEWKKGKHDGISNQ